MSKKIYKILSLLLCLCLVFEQSGFAQSIGQLDISGYLTSLHNSITQDKFRPLHLRYLSYDPLNNNFSLLVDKGNNLAIGKADLEDSAKSLMNYFFIGLTLPNESFWVNLRPDAETNIIDDELARTDIGKIMLEADVQLKKDTARYTSPNTPEGKEYWDKLYEKAGEIFGYENVQIPTLTRPWIVPDEILLAETKDGAYIFKATLKVLLEQDYLKESAIYNFKDERLKVLNEYSSQLIKELIIPKITKEVNSSKRYAPLRQVYYSLILAQWFKAKFYGKEYSYASLIDRRNLNDLTSNSPWSTTTYFKEYQKSFKNGEYNTSESVYTPYGQTIRSYFSGGIKLVTSSSPASNAFPADTIPSGSQNLANLKYDGGPAISPKASSAISHSENVVSLSIALDALRNPLVKEFVKESLKFSYGQYGVPVEIPEFIVDSLSRHLDELGDEKLARAVIEEINQYIRARVDLDTIYRHYKTEVKPRVTYELIKGIINGVQKGKIEEGQKGDLNIADIGCGNNALADFIAQNNPNFNIIGTDRLPYQTESKSPRVKFIQQPDTDVIPIDDNSCDIVFLISMIHHEDPDTIGNFLSQIQRILKDKGIAVVIEDSYSQKGQPIHNHNNLWERFSAIDVATRNAALRIIDWIGGMLIPGDIEMHHPFSLKSIEEWEETFKKYGFRVDSTKFIGFDKGRFHLNPQAVFELKKASSPLNNKKTSNNTQGITDDAVGGIDFRTLSIVTQAMSNLSVGVSNIPLAKLNGIDLKTEWQEIERLVPSGITPSSERIKEYLQISCYKGNIMQDKTKVISYISDILRQEEEQYISTEPLLRDILIVLESSKSTEELRMIFIGVKP